MIEKRERALAIARRMMQNRRQMEAKAIADRGNNPDRQARILARLAQLQDDAAK